MRLLNVYDVDDKTLLLRFKEPGRDAQTLLIESGFDFTRLVTVASALRILAASA